MITACQILRCAQDDKRHSQDDKRRAQDDKMHVILRSDSDEESRSFAFASLRLMMTNGIQRTAR
jgi:hypothetical protein